jgi:hypothetical protein
MSRVSEAGLDTIFSIESGPQAKFHLSSARAFRYSI